MLTVLLAFNRPMLGWLASSAGVCPWSMCTYNVGATQRPVADCCIWRHSPPFQGLSVSRCVSMDPTFESIDKLSASGSLQPGPYNVCMHGLWHRNKAKPRVMADGGTPAQVIRVYNDSPSPCQSCTNSALLCDAADGATQEQAAYMIKEAIGTAPYSSAQLLAVEQVQDAEATRFVPAMSMEFVSLGLKCLNRGMWHTVI